MADPDLTPDLIRRARAAGIAPSYRDSDREEVTVSAETLTAILGALGPAAAGTGTSTGTGDGQPPAAAPVPEEITAPQVRERSWGFAVQLYSLRSQGSWGHGDLRDLADLAA